MIRRFIEFIIPPPKWRVPVILLFGIIVGLTAHLLHISNAVSYMSDDPKTCINCHIMAPQYATWKHSSHANVASCNDCHVPQDNVARKYFFKAMDGLRHSAIFTMRGEEQVITIKEAGRAVVQENCIRCHDERLAATDLINHQQSVVDHGDGRQCWECHREVPHGRVRSLSSTPNAYVPLLDTPVPEWLQEEIKKTKTK